MNYVARTGRSFRNVRLVQQAQRFACFTIKKREKRKRLNKQSIKLHREELSFFALDIKEVKKSACSCYLFNLTFTDACLTDR